MYLQAPLSEKYPVNMTVLCVWNARQLIKTWIIQHNGENTNSFSVFLQNSAKRVYLARMAWCDKATSFGWSSVPCVHITNATVTFGSITEAVENFFGIPCAKHLEKLRYCWSVLLKTYIKHLMFFSVKTLLSILAVREPQKANFGWRISMMFFMSS